MSRFSYEQEEELSNNYNQREDDDEDDDENDLIEPEAVEIMDDEDETSSSITSSPSPTDQNENLGSNNIDTKIKNNMVTYDSQYNIENVNNHNNSILNDLSMIDDVIDDRKRFQVELEFVQSLANPYYLNFLAQRGYFTNQTFLNYLKYLMYWKEPEYCNYLIYPQCLALLELLQQEHFIKEIVNTSFSKFIDEHLLLIWLNYKKRRDWKRFDPSKLPINVENLFKSEKQHVEDDNLDSNADYFSANKFIENEKY